MQKIGAEIKGIFYLANDVTFTAEVGGVFVSLHCLLGVFLRKTHYCVKQSRADK